MPPKRPLYFGNQYLLLHKILETLKSVGLEIVGSGSEAEGTVPFYEFQLPTARLHLGTLVGLVNNPDRYKATTGDIKYWQNLVLRTKDIDVSQYSIREVSTAIETLVANGEVKKEVEGGLVPDSKVISLTAKGLESLESAKYENLYQKERDAKTLFESTVTTNYWMRAFTCVLALMAVLTFLIQGYTVFKPADNLPKPVAKSPCKGHSVDTIYILNYSLTPLSASPTKTK